MAKKTSIISTTLKRPLQSYEVPAKFDLVGGHEATYKIKSLVLKRVFNAAIMNVNSGPSFADHVFVDDALKSLNIHEPDLSDKEYKALSDCILGVCNDVHDEILEGTKLYKSDLNWRDQDIAERLKTPRSIV